MDDRPIAEGTVTPIEDLWFGYSAWADGDWLDLGHSVFVFKDVSQGETFLERCFAHLSREGDKAKRFQGGIVMNFEIAPISE